MLKKASTSLLRTGSLFALSLALIPGCNMGKKTESSDTTSSASTDKSTVLCKINGKPVINETEFNSNINQMLQANPYFKGAGANSLPLSIKRKFFDELIKQELILADASKSDLAKDAEFQKALEDMQKLIKRSLTIQFFEKKIYDGIVVDDSEITKHFQESKDRYVKNAGGVLVGGVRFESDKEADAFVAKSSSTATYADFEKMAKSKNAQFRSFGRLSKQEARGYQFENVPAGVKEAALSAKSLPHVSKVKAGKEVWVIHASDRHEPEMFEINEVKPQIISMLKNNKFREKLDQAITDLKAKMTIDVNEGFFKEQEAPAAASGQKHVAGNKHDAHSAPVGA
jgi:hypothetical protein